jgi:hypothetical protein
VESGGVKDRRPSTGKEDRSPVEGQAANWRRGRMAEKRTGSLVEYM